MSAPEVMDRETKAAEALRTWAASKPGVTRLIPRQLSRNEVGPFGRRRGGAAGPTPSEMRLGLAEGAGDLAWETRYRGTIPLPRWERPSDEAALRAATERRINRFLRGRFGSDAPDFAYRGTSAQAAAAILGTCETCRVSPRPGEDEPEHQPWCPEVGGWWCLRCRAWSSGATCHGCERRREDATTWSHYGACPACREALLDGNGETAWCSCGWREGE